MISDLAAMASLGYQFHTLSLRGHCEHPTASGWIADVTPPPVCGVDLIPQPPGSVLADRVLTGICFCVEKVVQARPRLRLWIDQPQCRFTARLGLSRPVDVRATGHAQTDGEGGVPVADHIVEMPVRGAERPVLDPADLIAAFVGSNHGDLGSPGGPGEFHPRAPTE